MCIQIPLAVLCYVYPMSTAIAVQFSSSSPSKESGRLHPTVVLAQRFESELCRGSIKEANFSHWEQIMPSQHNHCSSQEVYFAEAWRVAYVRNQKVASRYFDHKFVEIFGKGTKKIEQVSHLRLGSADNVFTVVRDPVRAAFSAYLEISRRHHGQFDGVTARYASMTCNTKDEATARFKAYLESLRNGELLGPEAFHAYPQAYKVNIDPFNGRKQRFDLIARVEHFEEDMLYVLKAVKGPGHWKLPPSTANDTHSTKGEACNNIDWEEQGLMQTLCDLYSSDFTCFDYDIPMACGR